jgi:dihydroflavonol-4-reductase
VSLRSDDLRAVMARVAPSIRPPRMVPSPVVGAAVTAVALTARVRGQVPVVCKESLQTLLHGHRYDGTRAVRELGLTYRPVEETLGRTARWLVDQGLVPAHALG